MLERMGHGCRFLPERLREHQWGAKLMAISSHRQRAVAHVGRHSEGHCKLGGVRYSDFISKLKVANVPLNRKIVPQIVLYDRAVFTNIVELTVPNWKEIKESKFWKKLDTEVNFPFIEMTVPELYTDDTTRFNHEVRKRSVEYTMQKFAMQKHWLMEQGAGE